VRLKASKASLICRTEAN